MTVDLDVFAGLRVAEGMDNKGILEELAKRQEDISHNVFSDLRSMTFTDGVSMGDVRSALAGLLKYASADSWEEAYLKPSVTRFYKVNISLDEIKFVYHLICSAVLRASVLFSATEDFRNFMKLIMEEHLLYAVCNVYEEIKPASMLDISEDVKAILNGKATRDQVVEVCSYYKIPLDGSYRVFYVCNSSFYSSGVGSYQDLPDKVFGRNVAWYRQGVSTWGFFDASGIKFFKYDDFTSYGIFTIGVGSAVHINSISKSRHEAVLVSKLVKPGGVAVYDDKILMCMTLSRQDMAVEHCKKVLGPVLSLDKVSRDLLLDALGAWFDGGGSARHAAAKMFCHRNTILNRLRRLERLVNKNLTNVDDVIELGMACRTWHEIMNREVERKVWQPE